MHGDPRDASKVKRYEPKVNPEEMPADWWALSSLLFGILGLMMRYKWCAWLALFSCLGSVANMKSQDIDFKQILTSVMFAVAGLFMNYFGPQPPVGK